MTQHVCCLSAWILRGSDGSGSVVGLSVCKRARVHSGAWSLKFRGLGCFQYDLWCLSLSRLLGFGIRPRLAVSSVGLQGVFQSLVFTEVFGYGLRAFMGCTLGNIPLCVYIHKYMYAQINTYIYTYAGLGFCRPEANLLASLNVAASCSSFGRICCHLVEY